MDRWFFICVMVVGVSVSAMISINSYNATKAGLEECPKFGAGKNGESIWVKSCKEYTETILNNKK